jgi:hypothetical protein
MSWIDDLFGRAAENASQAMSRRSFLRVGAIGAGAAVAMVTIVRAGVSVLRPASGPLASVGSGSCTHAGGAVASYAAGTKCGGWGLPGKDDCDCSECINPATGCPKGTALSQGWLACVPCLEDPTKGRRYKYQDCCGDDPGQFHPDCMGCSTGTDYWPWKETDAGVVGCYVGILPNGNETEVILNGLTGFSWCAGLGDIQCTQANATSQCCLVTDPGDDDGCTSWV